MVSPREEWRMKAPASGGALALGVVLALLVPSNYP
jgi:hypothetical protein